VIWMKPGLRGFRKPANSVLMDSHTSLTRGVESTCTRVWFRKPLLTGTATGGSHRKATRL
jgi:hypothetical protein